MSNGVWLTLMTVMVGVCTGLDVLASARKGTRRDWVRNTPGNSGWNLPMIVLFLMVLSLPVGLAGNWRVPLRLFSWLAAIFLQMSLYFLLLALLLPVLRRYLRAETCAVLWIVPNYLYIALYNQQIFNHPRWIVPLPIRFIEGAALVWLAGMLAVLGWKIVSHLRFRRWLLQGAEQVTDLEVLAVWQGELAQMGEKPPEFTLVTSPQATTPMTIGLFSKSVRVVLPRRYYTPEELKLIFRHELVHIGRKDAWRKFFLMFCAAMCWFNPLVWLAMGKSSEDLELSCDEAVTVSLDEGERRRYADLILRTAGDSRGFTTCLSASASALRYRLKNIVRPSRKYAGALFVAVVASLLFLACGKIGLAYGVGKGEEYIYPDGAGSACLVKVTKTEEEVREETRCRDEEALADYLSSLTLYQAVGSYAYSSGEDQIFLTYDTPRGSLGVVLWENYVRVMPSWEEDLQEYDYYVSGGLDWEKLEQLMEPAVV